MGASEEEKDRVSMEKFGCKFSELKDPQDRMSVGGTIGGNMRKAALTNKRTDEGEGQAGEEGQQTHEDLAEKQQQEQEQEEEEVVDDEDYEDVAAAGEDQVQDEDEEEDEEERKP